MSPAPKKPAPAKAPVTADLVETPEPVPPARETKRAWWCGVCDHSNTLLTRTCGGCGAERADA